MHSFLRPNFTSAIDDRVLRFVGVIILLLIFPFLAGLYPIVRFEEERIDIAVYPDHVNVCGYYIYRNPFPFPVVQGLSLPLPVEPNHPEPVMIAAEQLAPAEKQLRIVNLLGGYQFEVRFAARERKTVKVSYQQQAPCMDAHYILKTTQPWKRPLKKGLYRLFPHGVAITGSNYPLVSDGLNIRSFLKKNFMPTADWHFSWKDNSS